MSKNMSDKPFYKRRWFIVLLLIAGCFGDAKDRSDHNEDYEVETTSDIVETSIPDIVETSIPEEESNEEVEEPMKEKVEVIPKRKEETSTNNIRPQVKSKIDAYESFMDYYNSFIQNYDASNESEMIEYYDLQSNYDDVVYEFEALQDDLTSEELQYYKKVMNRVERLY